MQDEVLPPGQLAAPEEEDLRAGLVVGSRQRNHILVAGAGRVDDLLLLKHLLHGLHAVAQGDGALELQLLRGLVHLLAQVGEHLLMLAFEEQERLPNHGVILLAAGLADTGRVAAVNVELRAGARQVLGLPVRRRSCPFGGAQADPSKRQVR